MVAQRLPQAAWGKQSLLKIANAILVFLAPREDGNKKSEAADSETHAATLAAARRCGTAANFRTWLPRKITPARGDSAP